MRSPPPYAELAAATNFSFLRGASHPEELVDRAAALGLAALGIADRNSLAGVVRAHVAAKERNLRIVVGARLVFCDGSPDILAWPQDRTAYGRLCRLLTIGNRRAEKGDCRLTLADLSEWGEGILLAVVPGASSYDGLLLSPKNNNPTNQHPPSLENPLRALAQHFPGAVHLAARFAYDGDDRGKLAVQADLAARCGTPLLAINDVLYHAPDRRHLQDVVSCIRNHAPINKAGLLLAGNAERFLKPPAEMARLFRGYPEAVSRISVLISRISFSLDELRYAYPDEPTGTDPTPQAALIRLTEEGARQRYPEGLPDKVRHLIEYEIKLIGELDYAPYFLTVHDIVRFARARGILAQGRGSAANSAVCFCLGITEVDPARMDLLFERFISAERREPPDIDVDFEHERREEVIQYIYGKYGRARAGLAATVTSYRARSAVREVGKAFGLSEDAVGGLAGAIWGWSDSAITETDVRRRGLDPADASLAKMLALSREIVGFPRHLSQHVGGFVITRDRLDETVPIQNAAMEDRTVVEWDKDDLDALGILKIDVLGLGMLTCVRKAFDMLRRHYDRDLTLATIPAEDPAVYRMLQRADSIGVFQVESRAQMTMLPRLKPANFYDLVIEVAIVRPGPIQGDMVHPYLRRRQGLEPVAFPAPSPEHGPPDELEKVLGKTLGVPLFQEQAMRIAIVAAGFTPSEADRLRRAMATFRRVGTIGTFQAKMVEGMVRRGYDRDFAERCFRQIEGFGEYGFPESHAASFALLVYASAWLKCHYPDVFAAALLNSQPMGFYAPAQIVRDAIEHGVRVHPVDINLSGWDNTLEPEGPDAPDEHPVPPPPSPSLPRKGGEGPMPQPSIRTPPFEELPSRTESRASGDRRGDRPPPPLRGRDGEGGGEGGTASPGFAAHGHARPAAHAPVSKGLREKSRALRRDMTDAERRLWSVLRANRFQGYSFRRQVPMGHFIADFVCHDRRLVIELDGGQHGEAGHAAADATRDAWFQSRGYRVLRFWNNEVLENLDGTLHRLAEALRLPPSPALPRKGGERHMPPGDPEIASPTDAAGQGMSEMPATIGDAEPPPPLRGRDGEGGREGGTASPGFATHGHARSAAARLHPLHADMRADIWSDHAIRLGLRQIKGIGEEEARLIEEKRGAGYDSLRDLWLRTGLPARTIERLADADAFRSIGLDRRAALWAARGLDRGPAASGKTGRLPLFEAADHADLRREPDVDLPPMPLGEQVVNDYRFLKLSLKAHPASFLRAPLTRLGAVRHETLRTTRPGRRLTVAGLVLVRQRPGSARGVIFMTLEDETAVANVIVWPKVFERFRAQVIGARLIAATGRLQNEQNVIHLVAERIDDLTPLLATLGDDGTDLEALARCDEVRRPVPDIHEKVARRSRLGRLLADAPELGGDLEKLARATHAVLPKGRNFH
ncbi:error-prone DNA polymerase [Microbaculum sp. FT89]|uniref:error-prone DNA polymerase n=1 Tax=Microbaculum sp. FT89 TaxID=3447298 RepID=UPI003F531CDE